MTRRSASFALVMAFPLPARAIAQCPLETDRILHAPDGFAENGWFGHALDADGDDLVVGQPFWNLSRRTQGGGRVFVYRWGDSRWREYQELRAPLDSPSWDSFGFAIDLDAGGRTLVVGSPGADVLDPRDPVEDSGAVYVYHRVGREFVMADRLHASDVQSGARFGSSVAIQGDRLIVGASGYDGAEADIGAVYVFERRGEFWNFQQRLTRPVLGAGARVGSSVTVDGSWIATGATGFDGPFDSGTVLIYRFDGTRWNWHSRFDHEDHVVAYGYGCVLQGDQLLVSNRNYFEIPALHVYEFDGLAWNRTQDLSEFLQLRASGSIRLSGSTLVVGSEERLGLDGVLLFRKRGKLWHPEAFATPPEEESVLRLGEAVAFTETTDGTEVVIGGDRYHPDRDGVSTGIVLSAIVPPLLLDVQPEKVWAGMDLSFLGCGAQKQTLGLFALVAIDGVPTFERVALDTANRFGEFEAVLRVPPGLEGLNLKFQAFGTDESGATVGTQKVKIKFR